ncbi:hypothetical protein FLJC2902T_18640 [Flavobacterium limnosediminis JC2902]|uniref:Uncharacterized protein n=1 Tax=Flavobacterium limnosediminis JC2902 TaxID=1341181 RepID=V6SPE3_9FLAO|nr:hypothetical protein FLJC2902T_18640 [Flavobacterium limnosediminis JC2902]
MLGILWKRIGLTMTTIHTTRVKICVRLFAFAIAVERRF